MTPTVRLAHSQDIPALEALIPESARALSVGHYSPEQIEAALLHTFGVDRQLIDDGTYFVAEMEGQIAGCGGWSRRQSLYGGTQAGAAAEPLLLDPAREPARIRAFFVHPRWARQGIGAALLRASEQAARAAGFHDLVLLATLPGQPLYASQGFMAIEAVQFPLPGGLMLPGMRMAKHITETPMRDDGQPDRATASGYGPIRQPVAVSH
jgi:predicted N-acetyltransferase YhbS